MMGGWFRILELHLIYHFKAHTIQGKNDLKVGVSYALRSIF